METEVLMQWEGESWKVWEGELQVIPRIGETVVVKHGFAGERVHSVNYDLVERRVQVTVHAPFREYIRRRPHGGG